MSDPKLMLLADASRRLPVLEEVRVVAAFLPMKKLDVATLLKA